MKHDLIKLILMTAILILWHSHLSAIKFENQPLVDGTMINYQEFDINSGAQVNNAFETFTADLNGDGVDDIVSLGGSINFCYPGCGIQPPAPTFGVSVMLYQSETNSYVRGGVYPFAQKMVILDINEDGALDLILSSGLVLLNDGVGGFDQQIEFSETSILRENFVVNYFENINFPLVFPLVESFHGYSSILRRQTSHYLSVADWDSDGDYDIITPNHIYTNDGDLNFTKNTNEVAAGHRILTLNLNDDGVDDWIIYRSHSVETWLSNEAGPHVLETEAISNDVSLINQKADLNGDGLEDLIQSYVDTEADEVKVRALLTNDDNSLVEMEQDFSELQEIHPGLLTIKIDTKDMDNDGDNDVWIFGFFDGDTSCRRNQGVLNIYQNQGNGELIHSQAIHGIGHHMNDFRYQYMSANLPTYLDLNGDSKPDIVFPGDKPTVWLSGTDDKYKMSSYSSILFNTQVQTLDYNNDGLTDILSTAAYDLNCNKPDTELELTSVVDSVSGVLWQANTNGKYTPVDGPFDLQESTYVKVEDIDNDGIDEVFVTNKDLSGHFSTYYYHGQGWANKIELPMATERLAFTDINNDEQVEVVLINFPEKNIISVLGQSETGFELLGSINVFQNDDRFKDFKLVDMDGNGLLDIITQTTVEQNSISIWYNQSNGQGFAPSESFGNGVNTFAILDFNNDQRPDIFVANNFNEIWLNRGNQVFSTTDYNTSFFYENRISNRQVEKIVAEKIEVKDINSDGWEDLIIYDESHGYLYLNNSFRPNHYISFFNFQIIDYQLSNYYEYGYPQPEELYHPLNSDFSDFNGDGLTDMVNGGDRAINILTQAEEQVPTGLLFDPLFNGHGYSLFDMGGDNLYYNILYTFDDVGNPEWYAMINQYKSYTEQSRLDPLWGNRSIRAEYNFDVMQSAANESEAYAGFLSMIQNHQSIYNQFSGLYSIGEERRSWSLEPIIYPEQLPEVDFSGVWWAGPEDAGWGLTMGFVERGDDVQDIVILLYFYDSDGQPRWALGQKGGFKPNTDFQVTMHQVKGYGRLSPKTDLEYTPIGNLTINLNEVTQDISRGGSLSVDVKYMNSLRNSWVRNNIPIGLFTKPRQ